MGCFLSLPILNTGLKHRLQKRLQHRRFLMNIAKFLRRQFLIEHLWWLLLSTGVSSNLTRRLQVPTLLALSYRFVNSRKLELRGRTKLQIRGVFITQPIIYDGEFFAKKINGFQLLTVVAKTSHHTMDHRCSAGFYTCKLYR